MTPGTSRDTAGRSPTHRAVSFSNEILRRQILHRSPPAHDSDGPVGGHASCRVSRVREHANVETVRRSQSRHDAVGVPAVVPRIARLCRLGAGGVRARPGAPVVDGQSVGRRPRSGAVGRSPAPPTVATGVRVLDVGRRDRVVGSGRADGLGRVPVGPRLRCRHDDVRRRVGRVPSPAGGRSGGR
ncbi:MAG: hypothetical protein J07HB67_00145 [halophilic archaeon J07HB67]|nr:MAG: hypothetical protein J07HB67_00145 [halophilic archaeon J07HB67]